MGVLSPKVWMCGDERTAGAGTVNCAAVALWRRGETPVLALHGEVGGAVRCPGGRAWRGR